MQQLKSWWESFYGSRIPIAYMLRGQIPERWLRIHSLPESKRYPETPQEYTQLLSRHNTVASEILGQASLCLMMVGRYAPPGAAIDNPEPLPDIHNANFQIFDIIEDDSFGVEQEAGDTVIIWVAQITWTDGGFDSIIREVADDRQYHIMFASYATGEIYAPYDGGADLFLRSTRRRDELKLKYRRWLSQHPKGL